MKPQVTSLWELPATPLQTTPPPHRRALQITKLSNRSKSQAQEPRCVAICCSNIFASSHVKDTFHIKMQLPSLHPASAWPPELLQIVGAPVAVALWQPIPGHQDAVKILENPRWSKDAIPAIQRPPRPDLRHVPISRLLSTELVIATGIYDPKSNRADLLGMIELSRKHPSTPSQRLCKEGMLHSPNIVHFEDTEAPAQSFFMET